MRKDGYTRNPVGEKRSCPLKSSSSREENNRWQEPNFLGRRSQLQSSPSEYFGRPRESGRTLERSRARRDSQRMSGYIAYPMNRVEKPEYIGWNRDASSRGSNGENLPTTLYPPPKTSETSKEKRTLKIRADTSIKCSYRTWLRSQGKIVSKVFRYTF